MLLKLLFFGMLAAFPVTGAAQLQMSPQYRCAVTHFPPPGKISCVPIPFPQRVFPGSRLNERAVSLPQPVYPPAAIVHRAEGTVSVQVLIDEEGRVVSATAVSGHPMLRASAVHAAGKAKFLPALRSGQPVKVSGLITYVFTAPKRKAPVKAGNKKQIKLISRGILNGKAVDLPEPVWPACALDVEDVVSVSVLIDVYGDTISAAVISGHPLLRAAAVQAAMKAKFEPARVEGEPVRFYGVLNYIFARVLDWRKTGRVLGRAERGEWDRSGLRLMPYKLPDEFGEEKDAIRSLTSGNSLMKDSTVTYKEATGVIESIQAKLLSDLPHGWRFNFGVTLERIKTHIDDDTKLGLELLKLRDLISNPPDDITGEITPGINNVAALAGQFAFTAEERQNILRMI